jgi:hypothetical protein
VSSAAGSTGSRLGKVVGGVASVARRAALPMAALGVAAGAGIKSAIDSASNLNESISKVGVVFGGARREVLDWSNTAATAMGQSRQQALEAAGTFGNLFRAMGITEGEAAGMSTSMTQLAGDLASFNNVSPEDALLALRSGLVGEAEPLRKFGVQLSAARIEAQAMEMGLKKTKGEYDANAKAIAAYNIILEDTKLAQGDFERTSEGVANQQRITAAQFEDLKAKIGNAFLPVWQTMLGWFQRGITAFQAALPSIIAFGKGLVETVGNAFREVGKWIGSVWKAIGPLVMRLANELWGAIQKVWGIITKNLLPSLLHLWKAISPVLKVVGAVVAIVLVLAAKALPLVVRAISGVINIVAGLITAIGKVIEWVMKAVTWFGGKLVGAFDRVKNLGRSIFDPMMSAAKTVLNGILTLWNSTIGAIFNGRTINGPGPLPDITLPDLRVPLLDTGGEVLKTGLAVVHKGEHWSGVGANRMWSPGGGGGPMVVRLDRRRVIEELTQGRDYNGWW